MPDKLLKAQTRCISHEIRNHLSICDLYSQIIKKNIENSEIKNDAIENALNCIQKSIKIISNSLLDLKSLHNFTPAHLDLRYLLKTGVELSEIYIGEKSIHITSELCDGQIEVDENKFLACIVNLIKNAIEAIPHTGKIKLECKIINNKAHILISNTGTPISKEKQKQIFDEGFTTKTTGSGLGLYICKNNLAAQNAELKLNKSDKHSTEFEIIIPLS